MQVRTVCIALKTVKYSDSRSIVSCLARDLGRVSFIVNDTASRESRRRRALMMPGNAFSCIIDFRENRSLQTVSEILPTRIDLSGNPLKQSISLFVCDFVNTLLRDSLPDEALYDFIDSTIADITTAQSALANRAICFLVGMTHFMGIAPDMSTYRPGRIFDLSSGIFRDAPNLQGRWLDREESDAAARLARMSSRNMRLYRFTREQRARILDSLIDYFALHFGSLRSLRSLDILHSIFD